MLPLGCEEGGKRTIGRSDVGCCTGVLYYTWAYLPLLDPVLLCGLDLPVADLALRLPMLQVVGVRDAHVGGIDGAVLELADSLCDKGGVVRKLQHAADVVTLVRLEELRDARRAQVRGTKQVLAPKVGVDAGVGEQECIYVSVVATCRKGEKR